jgi:DNA repair exonuclease SbcCD ATPase subunit
MAITVSRFRGWRNEQGISLDAPITSVVADNGRGKSSLLNAIEWCLYGAVVTQKGSGIDERQNWELRTRTDKGDDEPTCVEIELGTADGTVKIRRERSASAKARDADHLTVEDPSGETVSGEGAESWLVEAGVPDWETYRRAHCFHQEAARQRVVAANERTAILAALLGLDDDLSLRNTIEANQPSKLFTEIDQTLDALNDEAHRALDLPRQRLVEIEERATEVGLDSSQLSESNAKTIRSQLIAGAQNLADRLSLTTELPDEDDAAAVRSWAPKWPTTARSESPALASLEKYRRLASQLDTYISKYGEEDAVWQAARSALQQERQTGGDESQRDAAVTAAQTRLTAANDALKQNNATAALLTDAKSALEVAIKSDECPVCETNVPGLKERLEATIQKLQSEEFQALQAAEGDARTTLKTAETARDALQELVRNEKSARGRVDEQRDKLREILAIDESTEVHDILAEAKKRRETVGTEISNLEGLAAARDQSIQDHQAGWGRLDLIENWLRASERTESSIDLSALPEWSDFNESLDELAGFGADLAFLGSIAREVQAERSNARAAEVNKALGKYYSLITQDDTAVLVNVHTTPQRISYDLVDASERPAVPVLNQAAINALSLAVLFAQSEAQTGGDSWGLVALDDPVQSLDAAKQKGLSQAIEELANSCSVLVATVPGHLSERIQDYVSKQRHVVTLGPWSETDGASIESEVDR